MTQDTSTVERCDLHALAITRARELRRDAGMAFWRGVAGLARRCLQRLRRPTILTEA